MPRTVLLTLGRLPKALDLARSFAAHGWRVVVAEPHRRHLAGASRAVSRSVQVPPPAAGKDAYLDALAQVVKQQGAELVVPVSEEVTHVAALQPRLPEGVRVATMPWDRLMAVYDKARFIEQAQAAGVAAPETALLGSPAGAALAASGEVIVKPVHTCSGRGLRRLSAGAALPAHDPDAPAIVQRLVRGRECSSCSIAHEGRLLGTVLYRGVMMSGSVAVAFERFEDAALADWIARFVAAQRWSGIISFDFIVDDAGRPWAIECNPRATSGLHFFRNEDIAAALFEPASASPMRHRGERQLMQFWSCLTEVQHAAFTPRFLPGMRLLMRTPDVSWRRDDPWPLLGMPYTAWPIIRAAQRRGVPFGEVATMDVGWFEGERAPAL